MNLTDKQKMMQRQSLPLDAKIQMTKVRIKEWVDHWDGDVYLAFSGGKDSTVLKHIIESMGYNIPCVFSNTGLEMPEIVEFARRQKNVVEIRPKKNYRDVWQKEGLPIGSKKISRQIRTLKAGPTGGGHTYKLYNEGITKAGHPAPNWKIANKWRKFVDSDIDCTEKCCDALKKEPIATYEKANDMKGRGITGMMASEGGYRSTMTQCNSFEGKNSKSNPMLFWNDDDVWAYINKHNVEVCSVYYDRLFDGSGEMVACDSPYSALPNTNDVCGELLTHIDGENRTGCMFCAFGAHLEKGLNRFQKMSITHPRQHKIVMDRMGMRKAMEMIDVKVDYE